LKQPTRRKIPTPDGRGQGDECHRVRKLSEQVGKSTQPRRAKRYTDTITQTLARRQLSQHVPTPANGRSFSEIVRNLARGFFEGVGQVAVYFDSLPLEEKHRIKAGLITLLSQGGSRDSWKHLVEDDQRLKRILVDRGWWVLQKDITGTVKREILRLGRDPEAGAVAAYLCGLFRADDLSRLRAKVNTWFDVQYLAARRQILLDGLEAHKSGQYSFRSSGFNAYWTTDSRLRGRVQARFGNTSPVGLGFQ